MHQGRRLPREIKTSFNRRSGHINGLTLVTSSFSTSKLSQHRVLETRNSQEPPRTHLVYELGHATPVSGGSGVLSAKRRPHPIHSSTSRVK